MQTISPCLWFDGNAEEAVNYYVSIFPNAKIVNTMRCGDSGPYPKGTVLAMDFLLENQLFKALNGGPHFKFNEAVSFFVSCKDQTEVDHYWDRLTSDGGAESQCGWLKDKYGVSWQIVPRALFTLMGDKDPAKAGRVMQAMMKMKKIHVPTLEQAHAG